MGSRGPSPLVPSLMLGALSLVIFGGTRQYVVEWVLALMFQSGSEEATGVASFMTLLLPISMLLIIHLLTKFFPGRNVSSPVNQQSSSSAYDAEGFGLGSLLLVVLFYVLYNLW